MTTEKTYFFDKPKNIQRLLYVFYSVCISLLVLDLFVDRHIYHPWEKIAAFYPLYGFIGCVLLVFIAKWMRIFLMRPENYYDKDETMPRSTFLVDSESNKES